MKKSIEQQLEQRKSGRSAFLQALCEGVPETYTVFVHSGYEETNLPTFARAAMEINKVPLGEREQKFQEILDDGCDNVDWLIRRDSADVMNALGQVAAVRDNKACIMKLAEEMPARLKKAKTAFLKVSPKHRHLSGPRIFEMLLGV
ncbi:hypothetical protein L0Y69_00110 [bacterium]|nr:hypothetical protein [bacterium]